MTDQVITVEELLASFPYDHYREVLPNQHAAFVAIAKHNGNVTLEAPTGSGKTADGYTFLKALLNRDPKAGVLYIAPSKTIVQQVGALHPDVQVAYGRNEHQCLYYKDESGVPKGRKADEIPCSFLVRHPVNPCPHYVNQETGKTLVDGVEPCSYYRQKFDVRQPGVIPVVTAAFALFAQVFQRQFGELNGVVIDEAHKIARAIRSVLSYEITDYHLERCAKLCRTIGADEEGAALDEFRRVLILIVRRRQANKKLRNKPLLSQEEIHQLLQVISSISEKNLEQAVRRAMREGQLDVEEEMDTLKQLEIILRDLRRYITSLGYALPTEQRGALNYLYAYCKTEKDVDPEGGAVTDGEVGPARKNKVRYRLIVKAYKVTGLVKKMLAPRSLVMSATIGNNVFGMETGIDLPIVSLPSDFDAKKTRIYMPTDTADLAKNKAGAGQPGKTMRRIGQVCQQLLGHGHRSLILTASNDERLQQYEIAVAAGLDVRTYGDGITPRDMAVRFRGGEGSVLVGTLAQYGEGYDLPGGIAPVVHILRPAYPNPYSPETQFEEERFGNQCWALWQWRVMIEALQARGRNIRGKKDRGVTIFYSQGFRRFVFASLPEYLQPSYRGEWRLDHCVEDTFALLGENGD